MYIQYIDSYQYVNRRSRRGQMIYFYKLINGNDDDDWSQDVNIPYQVETPVLHDNKTNWVYYIHIHSVILYLNVDFIIKDING